MLVQVVIYNGVYSDTILFCFPFLVHILHHIGKRDLLPLIWKRYWSVERGKLILLSRVITLSVWRAKSEKVKIRKEKLLISSGSDPEEEVLVRHRVLADRWRDEDSVGLKSISGEHGWLWDGGTISTDPKSRIFKNSVVGSETLDKTFHYQETSKKHRARVQGASEREISNWGGKILNWWRKVRICESPWDQSKLPRLYFWWVICCFLHGKRILFVTKFAFDHPPSD